ncbi:MAG: hypothetical protein ACRDLT_08125 [Solirubrobacteraceae bacterium]
MAAGFVISAVSIVAFAAGYRTGNSPVRALGVCIGGFVLIVAIFLGESALRYPTGEGWADRTTVLGHWVPDWEWMAGVWSSIAWFLAVPAGWLIRDVKVRVRAWRAR